MPLRSIESDWPPAMDSRVGRRGLEPLTPCASCKCATSCANGPSATLYRLHPVNRATHQTCSSLGVPTVRAQRSSANRSQLSRSDAPKPKISTVTGRIRHSGSTITEQKAIAHHVHHGLQLAHLVTHNPKFPPPPHQISPSTRTLMVSALPTYSQESVRPEEDRRRVVVRGWVW